ncbi:MAG TPA: hypothetical protein VI980_10145 [Acidimicrobiia bacterium]|nr:hypothetical protein [Acidimicrobiia bacterium]
MEPSTDPHVEIPSTIMPESPKVWVRVLLVAAMLMAAAVLFVATAPKIPSIEWTSLQGPPGSVNLDSLIAVNDGFAVLSGMTADGVLLWSTTDGQRWSQQPLEGTPTQLSAAGESIVAYDGLNGWMIERVNERWAETQSLAFPDEVRSRQGSGRPSVIGDDNVFFAVTIAGDVWLSEEGAAFVEVVSDPAWGPGVEQPFDSACRPPNRTSPDIPPFVITDSGYLALVSSNSSEPFGVSPVCEPRIWLSDDGRTWTESNAPLGNGAFVQDLGWRDGRYVAVGGFDVGDPAAWTSADGLEWEPVAPTGSWGSVDLVSVDVGPGGWIVLGKLSESSGFAGWTSRDGLCWEALPKHVGGGDAAVASTHIILADRTSYPELWVGTVLATDRSCG